MKARDIHAKAEEERELKQNFLSSLHYCDRAFIEYQKEGNLRGMSEVLESRSSVFKLLYQKTLNKNYLVLALHESLAGLDIASSLETNAQVMTNRGVGKIYEQLGEYKKAAMFFEKAIKAFLKNPPSEHNRPAVLADMNAHMETCKYEAGDKRAYKRLLSAIKELEIAKKENRYNRDVWLSGAHLRAAKILAKDDKDNAIKHLKKS